MRTAHRLVVMLLTGWVIVVLVQGNRQMAFGSTGRAHTQLPSLEDRANNTALTFSSESERADNPGENYHRIRREVKFTLGVSSVTDDIKWALLEAHNRCREEEKGKDIRYLEWDNTLEDLAQRYIEACDFNHSPENYRTDVAGFKHVGENKYVSADMTELVNKSVKSWCDQKHYYDFKAGDCQFEKDCSHYTQVIWSSTQFIGCGVQSCPLFKNTQIQRGIYVLCHYGPAGNIADHRPYKPGEPCSACPKQNSFCVKGLCSRMPMIGSKNRTARLSASVCLSFLSFLFWRGITDAHTIHA